MANKLTLGFLEIREKLQACKLPQVDRIVGIGTGGTVPASLVAYQLGRPLTMITINYRAEDNSPRFDEPRLLSGWDSSGPPEQILLVDDVSVSGKTMELAKKLLVKHQVTTLVMKGTADIVLFPEVAQCVNWPWKEVQQPELIPVLEN